MAYKKLKKTAKGLKVSEKELKRLKKASPRNTDLYSSKKIAEKNLDKIRELIPEHSDRRNNKFYQEQRDKWAGRKKGKWVKIDGKGYHSDEEPGKRPNIGSYMNPYKKKPKKK